MRRSRPTGGSARTTTRRARPAATRRAPTSTSAAPARAAAASPSPASSRTARTARTSRRALLRTLDARFLVSYSIYWLSLRQTHSRVMVYPAKAMPQHAQAHAPARWFAIEIFKSAALRFLSISPPRSSDSGSMLSAKNDNTAGNLPAFSPSPRRRLVLSSTHSVLSQKRLPSKPGRALYTAFIAASLAGVPSRKRYSSAGSAPLLSLEAR